MCIVERDDIYGLSYPQGRIIRAGECSRAETRSELYYFSDDGGLKETFIPPRFVLRYSRVAQCGYVDYVCAEIVRG